MKNQINTNVKLSKSQKTLVITQGSETFFLNVNLIKHVLEIPYTRKNGVAVTIEEIRNLKEKSQAAYDEAVMKKKVSAGA